MNKILRKSVNFVEINKFNLLVYAMVFFYSMYATIDPDLGWHLVYGEYFINTHRFLTRDIFSWTMPNYAWFNISWIFDAFLYILFNKTGFTGLSLVEGVLLCLSYYLLICQYKLSLVWKIVSAYLFIFFTSGVAGAGLRVQLFEIFNIIILNWIIFRMEKTNNIRYACLLPVLMLFWVNIHGSFIIGLFLINMFLASKMLNFYLNKDNRNSGSLGKTFSFYVLILLLSDAAVLINPFGINAVFQLIDYLPASRVPGIIEWFPLPFKSEIWLGMFLWTIFIMYRVFKKRRSTEGLYQAATALIFSYLAYKSRRMVPPYFIVTFPIFLGVISKIKYKFNNYSIIILFLAFLTATNISGIYRLVESKFFKMNLQEYCETGPKCSVGAANYINKNPLPLRTFSMYNLGGFSIWQNRNFRVFIDGRMDQWRKNGLNIFSDHQEINDNTNIELFNKYNFDAAYLQTSLNLTGYLKRQANLGRWKIVYEDKFATIFIRNVK